MTLDEFYDAVIYVNHSFGDITTALSSHRDNEEVKKIMLLNLESWVGLATYASFRNRVAEHYLTEDKKATLSPQEVENWKLERKVCKDIYQHALNRISREHNLLEGASILIQMQIENYFAQGQGGPKLTALSPDAAEGQSVLMQDGRFTHSNGSIVSTAPKNPKSSPPELALVTHKHNACPYVVTVDANGDKAAAWHISHSAIFPPEGPPKQIDKPANMPDDRDMQYLVLGLTRDEAYKYLPAGINAAKIVDLPSDIFLEKIGTFREAGTVTWGSSGTESSTGTTTEPASYDSTYYPKSDTLILWGKMQDGSPCAWFMTDAVRSNDTKQWQRVILGTAEQPLLYWDAFLKEHFSDKDPAKIGAADKLIQAFSALPTQQEKIKAKRNAI